jgi:hypothetical protein
VDCVSNLLTSWDKIGGPHHDLCLSHQLDVFASMLFEAFVQVPWQTAHPEDTNQQQVT